MGACVCVCGWVRVCVGGWVRVCVCICACVPENVKYFNCLGSMRTSDAKCTREIKSSFAMTTTLFSKKKALVTSKLDLNLGRNW